MALTPSPTLHTLLARRLNRRRLLGRGAELAALGALARAVSGQTGTASELKFPRVAPSKADTVIVPDGYRADVVLRWGDPLFADGAALDSRAVARGALLAPEAAAAQARQFGYNCDGIGLFSLGGDRQLLCVNHEFPLPILMFPGWMEARDARALGAFVRERPSAVAYMQAACGLSVVELVRGAKWEYVRDSRYNRRITAHTAMEITGPARDHALLNPRGENAPLAFGTLGNCAAGTTPWRTYVTAEENVDDYFGNGAAAALGETELAHRRFGLRQRDSAHRWEYVDPRFDVAANPTELLKFGWIVELDPFDPESRPKKRTALGRFKHESATTVLAADGRAVVYMGDDQQFEYFYKFVTRDRFDPQRPAANRDLLDAGTLYVARLDEDGRGEWLPLVHGRHPELTAERGFASQADVLLRCREAADRLGATPLDRPEDVAVNPRTGNVYLACTQNLGRDEGDAVVVAGRTLDTRTDRANPRAPNTAGHILEFMEQDADAAATTFRWDIFLLAGSPSRQDLVAALPAEHSASLRENVTYFGGATDIAELSAFANPDNLGFDGDGNLWIVTDGNQPGDNNDGCFACATEGPERGHVRQFMSGPVGAEVCGCEFTADGRALFLTLQHPGEAGSATRPQSHWPDGGDAAPRPSVIAIEPESRSRKFGT
jgi:secreted PhoX family phosphatase